MSPSAAIACAKNSQEFPAEPEPCRGIPSGYNTPSVPRRNIACLEDVHPLGFRRAPRNVSSSTSAFKESCLPFSFPPLSPIPSPRIHGLSLNITVTAGEQVSREAAPDGIIPFSSSDVALKQNSDCWADSRFDQLRVKTWTSCPLSGSRGLNDDPYVSLMVGGVRGHS